MSSKDSANKCFLVYYDNEVIVCRLPDEEAGKLFKSLFPYSRESVRPDFEGSPALAMAFDILSMAIDRGKERYAERCEKNRQNVSKRWNKNDTTVYDGMPNNTNVYDGVPYKEKDKNIEKDNINYQLIADMYNATCVSFPRLTKLSEKRKKAIRARLKSYTMEDFKKLFEMAEASSFLKGQNNRNWSATFDWLIADGNMAKVLDGNYSENGTRQQAPQLEVELPEYYKLLGKREPSPDDPFQ